MSAPLAHYRKHRAGVELICGECMLTTVLDLEAVISGLQARGRGGQYTGIAEVGKKLRRPCERCGSVQWQTRPKMPAPADPGIPDPRGLGGP